MEITEIVQQLDSQIAKLQEARRLLQGESVKRSPGRPRGSATPAKTAAAAPAKPRRKLSAEARARIAEAQKRRWAAAKKADK